MRDVRNVRNVRDVPDAKKIYDGTTTTNFWWKRSSGFALCDAFVIPGHFTDGNCGMFWVRHNVGRIIIYVSIQERLQERKKNKCTCFTCQQLLINVDMDTVRTLELAQNARLSPTISTPPRPTLQHYPVQPTYSKINILSRRYFWAPTFPHWH